MRIAFCAIKTAPSCTTVSAIVCLHSKPNYCRVFFSSSYYFRSLTDCPEDLALHHRSLTVCCAFGPMPSFNCDLEPRRIDDDRSAAYTEPRLLIQKRNRVRERLSGCSITTDVILRQDRNLLLVIIAPAHGWWCIPSHLCLHCPARGGMRAHLLPCHRQGPGVLSILMLMFGPLLCRTSFVNEACAMERPPCITTAKQGSEKTSRACVPCPRG